MKNKNFALILSLFIILIVALGAVSAADALDDISSDSDDSGILLYDDSDFEDDDWDDDSDYEDDDDWDDDSDYEGDDWEDDFDYGDIKIDFDLASGEHYLKVTSNLYGAGMHITALPKALGAPADDIPDDSDDSGSSDADDSDSEDASDDMDDDSDEDSEQSPETDETYDEDVSYGEAPVSAAGSESGADVALGSESTPGDNSSKKIDLTDQVAGHPILMLILSLFALFAVPFNKR